jgi:hypothetical protein
VSKGEVVHSVAADDDQVEFTAGMDKLYVYLGNSSVITRFDLDTAKSEATYRLPPKSKVDGLHIGSAAYGPLMVCGTTADKKEVTFFVNTATMGVANYVYSDPKKKFTHWASGHTIRVSANGRVFGYWRTNTSPQGFHTLVLAGNTFKTNYEHVSYGHVVPGPDGKVVYTAHGLYTPEGRPLGDQKDDNRYKLEYTLPAVEGNLYYMSVGTSPNRQVESLNIHFVGDKRPIAVLTDVDLPADRLFAYDRGRMGLEKRVFLIPSADLIVSIPQSNDRLILQKFSLETYLKDSPFDYLVVTSKPPSSCRRDAVFNYQIKAMSKAGGIKFRRETAPKGMTVEEDGKVSWRVPLLYTGTKQHVVVMVADASGQEKPHSFDINILDRAP